MPSPRAIVVMLVLLAASSATAEESPRTVVDVQIHPKLDERRCGRLPVSSEVPGEVDFPRLLPRGWVSLAGSTFDRSRETPCVQDLRIEFPSRELYLEFVASMLACPPYPTPSGADYGIQSRIFERTAAGADVDALAILLAKDGRCASELNPPLYAKLRANPLAFLQAFDLLAPAQQDVAIETHYDLNVALRKQQFSSAAIDALPEAFRLQAITFNKLLARHARLSAAQRVAR
jgi:hypothetical protein